MKEEGVTGRQENAVKGSDEEADWEGRGRGDRSVQILAGVRSE